MTGTNLLTSRACSVSTIGSFGWVNLSSECIVHSSSQLSFRLSHLNDEFMAILNVLRVSFSNTGFPSMSIELSSLPKYPCVSLHCTLISTDLNVLRILRDDDGFSAILPPQLMTAGAQNFLKIYSIDRYTLKRTSGGALFYVLPTGMSNLFIPTFAADNLDGSYSAAIVPRYIGACSADVLELVAGTLLAEFFDGDPSQPSSSKLYSEMHDSINFESQTKHFSYSSIRWTGYLRPHADALHTLHVYARGGGIRIWLDHKLVLNNFDISSSNGSTILLNLTFARVHYLVADYIRRETPASVQLKWSNDMERLTIIPSKHFHHGNHHVGSPFSVLTVAGPVSSLSELTNAITLFTAGEHSSMSSCNSLFNDYSGLSSFLQVNLLDDFGNAASYFGQSRIHLHSPNLLSSPVRVSDTERAYEISSRKATKAAQVWVQRLIPSGLYATAYSYPSGSPQAQYMASSLDLPCVDCFHAWPGQSYIYRFVHRV
jgi:hypothetical protein